MSNLFTLAGETIVAAVRYVGAWLRELVKPTQPAPVVRPAHYFERPRYEIGRLQGDAFVIRDQVLRIEYGFCYGDADKALEQVKAGVDFISAPIYSHPYLLESTK